MRHFFNALWKFRFPLIPIATCKYVRIVRHISFYICELSFYVIFSHMRRPNYSDQEILLLADFVEDNRMGLFGQAGHCSKKVRRNFVNSAMTFSLNIKIVTFIIYIWHISYSSKLAYSSDKLFEIGYSSSSKAEQRWDILNVSQLGM